MLTLQLLTIALCLAVFALFANRLENSVLTLPMLCLGLGVVLANVGAFPMSVMFEGLELVAEATLAIMLFADAAHLKLARLRKHANWPMRMLLFGLPLAVIFGSVAHYFLFPMFSMWEMILLAALLVPTDAALGMAVFTNKSIDEDTRNTLLAESGLNDGLILPFIIFVACAAVGGRHDLVQTSWLFFAIKQIGFGIFAGVVVGTIGGWALHRAVQANLAAPQHCAIFALLLVLITYLLASYGGGNAFVAVFVAGLAFGRVASDCASMAREFLESDGLLLTMVSFLFIGAILVPIGLSTITLPGIIAIVLSLFVIRPAAVWLSMLGSSANNRTKLFMGWFGPRGLATALFAVVVLSEFKNLEVKQTILAVTSIAVLISTVLHGVSAHWADKLLGKQK